MHIRQLGLLALLQFGQVVMIISALMTSGARSGIDACRTRASGDPLHPMFWRTPFNENPALSRKSLQEASSLLMEEDA